MASTSWPVISSKWRRPYDGPGEITAFLGASLASDILTLIGNSRSRADRS